MDLDDFDVEDLFLGAIRSELDSQEVYETLARGVDNAFLKDRLRFLADEEVKHRIFIEEMFKVRFPGRDIVVPDEQLLPLPEVTIDGEEIQVSRVMEEAMRAEKAAHDFYLSLADRFDGEEELQGKLRYLAKMEMGHFRLLEMERESLSQFEDYLVDWPMMHSGP